MIALAQIRQEVGDHGLSEEMLDVLEEETSIVPKAFYADKAYYSAEQLHRLEVDRGTTSWVGVPLLKTELSQLRTEQEDLELLDSSYQKYLKFGFEVATHLSGFYEWADIETKHKFLCSIFPHKVIYEGDGRCRTPQMNEVIALFTGLKTDFEEAKNTKAALLSGFCEMGTLGGT